MSTEILRVDGLSVAYSGRRGVVQAVSDVSLTVGAGRCLGLVGESGSGKSTVGLAVQGLLTRDRTISATGTITVAGTELDPVTERGWDAVRGHRVTTVFQDPMSSLDPTMTVGRMLTRITGDKDESLRWLDEVEIRDPAAVLRSYPHQLSGGMRQRVMIALALARRPAVLVADEPTTALDVSVQAQILALLRREQGALGCGVIFVTHDLGVARSMCDDIAVMRAGQVVERGAADAVFSAPQDGYTRRLMSSRLTLGSDRDRPVGLPEPVVVRSMVEALNEPPGAAALAGSASPLPGAPAGPAPTAHRPPPTTAQDVEDRWAQGRLAWESFIPAHEAGQLTELRRARSPVLNLTDVVKTFPSGASLFSRPKAVLHGVRLSIGYRESVALVGESGSGKSTVLRIAAGLETADSGEVYRSDPDPDGVQVVFQDAGASLTPWRTVEQILLERVANSRTGRALSAPDRDRLVALALERVALDPAVLGSKPSQLSGGQRQRVAIARAIVIPPTLLLCDEPTSALDVSIACTVLNLLNLLRQTLGLSILFVTHDLAAARVVSDRVLVINEGRVVESVASGDVTTAVTSDYARRLLDAVLT